MDRGAWHLHQRRRPGCEDREQRGHPQERCTRPDEKYTGRSRRDRRPDEFKIMKLINKKLVSFAALLACSFLAQASEFWLQPLKFVHKPGEDLVVNFKV